jgi:hypothetical protein
MLKGANILIVTCSLAVVIWFINIIFLDQIVATINTNFGVDPSSPFYVNSIVSKMAMLEAWMPVIAFVLGVLYFLFDRVFLRESYDREY